MKYSLIATWNMSIEGMKVANDILKNGGQLKDAIIKGINVVENDPSIHSVGYGGLPDENGQCSYDASYMNGDDLKFGSVGSLRNIKNVIDVAELLSHESRNNFLVGEGALEYALAHGYKTCDMLTKDAYDIYLKEKDNKGEIDPYHDTVCFIGMLDGHMATGVSTSGLFMKHKDRLGDSPICGAGFYCDSKIGGCCATGMGEDVQRSLLSYRCVSLMKDGLDVQAAVQKSLDEFMERIDDVRDISLIAMDKDGNIGATTNHNFAYTYASDRLSVSKKEIRKTSQTKIID